MDAVTGTILPSPEMLGGVAMDDMISKQAAIDDAHSQIWYRLNPNMKERMDKWLSELPSVQPEQKIGRWIYMKDCEDWFCSNCKDIFMLLEGTPKDNDYNYCPNCGAYMKGENNERDTF